MRECDVRTEGEALAYLTDCTLATVCNMASIKGRKKHEFKRQIAIAQKGIDWIKAMGVDASTTRAGAIIRANMTVAQWAMKFMPETHTKGAR